MTITHNTEVRSLQIITHLVSIAGLVWLFQSQQWHYLLISLGFYWTIGVLGINIGFHRLISHRSFKTWKWMEYFLGLVGTITTVGSPLAWVALHRKHHKHTETELDPHSPYRIGWVRAWFGIWKVNRLDPKTIKDIRKQSFYKLTHKYYIPINVIYCAALMLIDPMLAVFAYALPAVLVLHSTSAIIVIAHMHGYKTYALRNDESRNSWIASLITLGEGWHNNHHAYPGNWKSGEKWWEIDPPSWIIKLIRIDTKNA
jgi:stearoyl-CoA desaturase (delta-9 desaturase)